MKKSMHKRVFSLMVAAIMVVSVTTVFALDVSANSVIPSADRVITVSNEAELVAAIEEANAIVGIAGFQDARNQLPEQVVRVQVEQSMNVGDMGVILSVREGLHLILSSHSNGLFELYQDNAGQRHFEVYGSLTIYNVTLTRRNPGNNAFSGGVSVNGGRLMMAENGIITGNRAVNGGGVFLGNGGRLYLGDGSGLTGNTATNGGGVFVGPDSVLSLDGTTTLSGNTATNGGGIFVGPDAELNLSGHAAIAGNTGNRGGGVHLSGQGAVFNMDGGAIRANLQIRNGQQRGGAVFVDGGAIFNMTGGTIEDHHALNTASNNSAYGTPGVFLTGANTVFNMLGDAHITNNTSRWNGLGGSVGVHSGAEFNMSGNAMITASRASVGGASVYVTGADSVFNMSENAILDGDRSQFGETHSSGNGVNVNNRATFNMHDNAIIRNHVATTVQGGAGGGGVHLRSGSAFNMFGGTIENNRTSGQQSGGGVRLVGNSTFDMFDGVIRNNTATVNGGGVQIQDNGIFEMFGGAITNNNGSHGGGVHLFGEGLFNMMGNSIISDNHATVIGGGLRAWGLANINEGTIINNTVGDASGFAAFAARGVMAGTVNVDEFAGNYEASYEAEAY